MKYITTVNGEEYEIEINRENEVIVNGQVHQIDFRSGSPSIYSLIIDNYVFEAAIDERGDKYGVLITGDLYEVTVTDERAQRLARASSSILGVGDTSILAPMPGLVVAVPVQEGQEIKRGQTVLILESMKMQNELKANLDGIIYAIRVKAGESVDQNQVLVVIEPIPNV
jgi:biotin carboxyl carrier protein